MTETDTRAQVSDPLNHVLIPALATVIIAMAYLFTLDVLGWGESQLAAMGAIAAAVTTYMVAALLVQRYTGVFKTHG